MIVQKPGAFQRHWTREASKDAEASREREPEEKVLEEKFPWKAEATIPKAVSPAVPKTAVKEGPKTAAKMISKAAPKAVPKATTISAKKSESQVKPGMKEQNKADEVHWRFVDMGM